MSAFQTESNKNTLTLSVIVFQLVGSHMKTFEARFALKSARNHGRLFPPTMCYSSCGYKIYAARKSLDPPLLFMTLVSTADSPSATAPFVAKDIQ